MEFLEVQKHFNPSYISHIQLNAVLIASKCKSQNQSSKTCKYTFNKNYLDVNECDTASTNACDANGGACINNDGSYTCECKDGWTGDGLTCTGMKQVSIFISTQKKVKENI